MDITDPENDSSPMDDWQIRNRARAAVAAIFDDHRKELDGFVSEDEEHRLLEFIRLQREQRAGYPYRDYESAFVADRGRVAFGRLVTAYLPLVRGIASRYEGRGLPREDLVQEGSFGLMKAIDHFDDRRGTRLGSCAQPWIHSTIGRAIERSRTIHLPQRTAVVIRKIHRVIDELNCFIGPGERYIRPEAMTRQDLERVTEYVNSDPQAVQLSPEDVSNFLQLSRRGVVSLFEPIGDSGRILQDMLGDRALEGADGLDSAILEALDILTPMEKAVVELRCGIGVDEPLTLEELGQRFHCSAEWIRKVEKVALNKLRIDLALFGPLSGSIQTPVA
jgi:RNA polymerase primary sigma factor